MSAVIGPGARWRVPTAVAALAMLGACAPLLSPTQTEAGRVLPVYRIEQPAGTAPGQTAVGRMDLAAGRLDAAIVRFRQALMLDPDFTEAHNGLGIAYGLQGRHEQALASLQRALQAEPDSPVLLNNVGYAWLLAGDLTRAGEALTRAHRRDPGHPRTRENLAMLAGARERAARAAPGAVGVGPAPVAAPGVESTLTVASASVSVPGAAMASEPIPATATASASIPAPAPSHPLPRLVLDALEVSNAVGTARLARRTAQALTDQGASVTRLTDHRPAGREHTEIQFRSGFEAQAQSLGAVLAVRAALVGDARLRHDINVRLVIGRDLAAQPAVLRGQS